MARLSSPLQAILIIAGIGVVSAGGYYFSAESATAPTAASPAAAAASTPVLSAADKTDLISVELPTPTNSMSRRPIREMLLPPSPTDTARFVRPLRALSEVEAQVGWAFLNEAYRGRYDKTLLLSCDGTPSTTEDEELRAGISSFDVAIGNADEDAYPDALVTYQFDDCLGGSGLHGNAFVYYRGVPGGTFVHGHRLEPDNATYDKYGLLTGIKLKPQGGISGTFTLKSGYGIDQTINETTLPLRLTRTAKGEVQIAVDKPADNHTEETYDAMMRVRGTKTGRRLGERIRDCLAERDRRVRRKMLAAMTDSAIVGYHSAEEALDRGIEIGSYDDDLDFNCRKVLNDSVLVHYNHEEREAIRKEALQVISMRNTDDSLAIVRLTDGWMNWSRSLISSGRLPSRSPQYKFGSHTFDKLKSKAGAGASVRPDKQSSTKRLASDHPDKGSDRPLLARASDPNASQQPSNKVAAGAGSTGLSLPGWQWDTPPKVNETSTENGKIEFEIDVDRYGNISRIERLVCTVSPQVEQVYRSALEKANCVRAVGNTTRPQDLGLYWKATGRVAFDIHSR